MRVVHHAQEEDRATTGPAARRPGCRTPSRACRRAARSWARAWCAGACRAQAVRQAVAQPEHLAARAHREAEVRDRPGDDCSQPPEGVALTMLPQRSMTSIWHGVGADHAEAGDRRLAGAGGVAGQRVGARPRRRGRPSGVWPGTCRAAGPARRRRRPACAGAALYSSDSRVLERHVDGTGRRNRPRGRRRRAWRIRRRVWTKSGPTGSMRADVEALQQRELLQEHGSLAPGAAFQHGVAVVVVGDRVLDGRLPARRSRRR